MKQGVRAMVKHYKKNRYKIAKEYLKKKKKTVSYEIGVTSKGKDQ